MNKAEKKLLSLLIDNPDYHADELAIEIGVAKRTVERAFASLQKKHMIERIGSRRDGHWIVTK